MADRVFTCPNGHRLDRDLNAAINLARWDRSQPEKGGAEQPPQWFDML
ncbi:transposase [Mycobacterium sp. SVM_VP21]|nr:transposase [Mycobacterium sp. SVM_VP21]